jgi:NitT/TauT family transport system ATP-binding protein
MAYIEVKNLHKDFERRGAGGKNETINVLDNISFEINRGEFVCLLGFSGCGKSTLLNILAGFERPTSGMVSIDGVEVRKPSPHYLTIFQHYGLLPWRNVIKNVEFGMENADLSAEERKVIAEENIELVGLAGLEQQFPSQLSGGQQQRVAIARALASNPDVLFMDEPFGALDPITRNKLQDDMLRIVKQEQKTVIFVTHDIEEAVYLSDRVIVMASNPGRIEKIYDVKIQRPRDRNSSGFGLYRKDIYNKLFSIKENYADYMI